MADLVMGAMGNLIPKLYLLLKEEYSLQKGVKERISSLTQELVLAQATLRKVAQVPWDELDEQVQIWARQVREASYDMEDVLDTFLVHVKGHASTEQESLLKPLKKMANLIKMTMARRKICGDVKDIMTHLQEVTERCRRYKVDDIMSRPATTSTIDPRLAAMYTQVNKLVGMDESSDELMSMLQNPKQSDVSSSKMKTLSIVGVGGLGKTTLAKVVYDKLKGDFDCTAFVPVGRKPDLKKIFKDILIDLDKQRYLHLSTAALDERQLIDELCNFFLENKRYLIIIDDIWEIESWETIKLAMDNDNDSGGRVIITTRKLEVAIKADKVYKLQHLPYDSSRELFVTRIFGHRGKYVQNQPDEISDKFLRKCSGIPLAIITIASLLAGKQREEWPGLYNTIDFVSKENKEAENTIRILSFSYYDLPSHLRTCLLYLSAFPEDSFVPKESLVWMWVAEGFVHEEKGISLFEIGEGYFNDLINRSMIQAVESEYDDNIIIGCRVHDMVLDFIHSMSQEENFFTVLDNNPDIVLQSNVRRLANHKRTIGHTHQAKKFEMLKLRSFIALECVIETWAPLSRFKLLRVLAIENCEPMGGDDVRVEHIGHLFHLRFLSLSGTRIRRIPKGIGALRFLQTLDLWRSKILELPSSSSLPKQLACLRITLHGDALDGNVLSWQGMTSLEELSLHVRSCRRWVVKDLGCLRELRVLCASFFGDEENERDLVESLRHLHKLQSLTIYRDVFTAGEPTWQAMELVLPRHLRHLALYCMEFYKLPSCINASCLPNLSHLDLRLQHMDEQDLKILGGLPELLFLGLELWSSSAIISNISDSNSCYFPKLRCCRLPWSTVLFIGNKEDKSVSFHIWNALGTNIGIVPFVFNHESQRLRPSISDDELKSDDKLQCPMPSVSDDDELHRPHQFSKIQHGLATLAYYLFGFFVHVVVAFVRRRSLRRLGQYPSMSNAAAMPSVSHDESKGSICSKRAAAPPCFMPSLEVLHFGVRGTHPIRWDNLGLEFLSSLREIRAHLYWCDNPDTKEKVEAALRRAAQVHPNRPTLRLK